MKKKKKVRIPKPNYQFVMPPLTEDGELEQLADLNIIKQPADVCLRIETAADFADAVRLLMLGHHVTALPVAGVICSFVTPLRLGTSPQKTKPVWTIKIQSTAASVASAVSEILSTWEYSKDLTLLFEAQAEVEEAFTGLIKLLNFRAGRLLTVCDIADALEWFVAAAPATARLDCCVSYGHASWGWFLKRETDTPELASHSPQASHKLSRTAICHVCPSRDDLDAIAVYGARSEHIVGITNAAKLPSLMTCAIALSTDKTVALPSYGWRPRVQLDLINKEDTELSWGEVRLVTRSIARDHIIPPPGLQPVWKQQHLWRRLTTIEITSGRTTNHEHHARLHQIRMRNAMLVPPPDPQRPGGPISTDSPADIIVLDPMKGPGFADDLLTKWDDTLGLQITGAVRAP